MDPLFLTMESIDGLGKTTQVDLLYAHLARKNVPVYRTKEPGDSKHGSSIGADLRKVLFGSSGTKTLAPGVSDLLFLADHVQNSYDIEGELSQGRWVISDRYADSQFAYAGSTSKRCPEWAYQYYREQYGVEPSVIILLVAMPETPQGSYDWALERAQKRQGIEYGKQEGKAWNDYIEQKRIQEQYIKNLKDKHNVVMIGIYANEPILEVHEKILSYLSHHFKDSEYGKIFQI